MLLLHHHDIGIDVLASQALAFWEVRNFDYRFSISYSRLQGKRKIELADICRYLYCINFINLFLHFQ